MRCLLVASEVAGFAKTGGLADVAASLPPALARRGVNCAVMMPLYGSVRRGPVPIEDTGLHFEVPLGNRPVKGGIWKARLPGSDVPVFLIAQPEFFERDDAAAGRGLYQYTTPDGQRADYPDNAGRFGFFSRAVLAALPLLDFWPDVLHANDWQTGLAPVYLRELYWKHPRTAWRERYEQIHTVFTIHNLAYQGLFWHFDMPMLGLSWDLFRPECLEFFGKINFLKAGIVFSDRITAVSPTYAREIQTPYYGCGLQGVLLERSARLVGIVNGVDYTFWDPATDPHLAAKYDVDSAPAGKARCKAALQAEFGLDPEPRAPLLGVVTRLADQKGVDLIVDVVPARLRDGVQLVVLGDGDKKYREALQALRVQFPRRVGVSLGISEPLAHQIEAGADAFLMPSRYEPCGLNQLYSLKYGTPPVVRATGGLADTVVDATPENLAAGTATGFAFRPYSAEAFGAALDRCLSLYRDDPTGWRKLQQTGMRQDWSWHRSAAEYDRLFRALVGSL